MNRLEVGVVVRALLLAGYTIERSQTGPRFVTINCCRAGLLGAKTHVMLVLVEDVVLAADEIEDLQRVAQREHRELVLVSDAQDDGVLRWQDLYNALGGEVPSWRAIAPSFREDLLSTSENRLPDGQDGEAWFQFESMVLDGLEYCLGRRAHHFGGVQRGRPVSDIVAQLPDNGLLVLDAKATGGSFNATVSNLRALGEYSQRQVERQRGHNTVVGAVVVSSEFSQDDDSLTQVSLDFYAQYGVPLSFLTAAELAEMVELIASDPSVRPSVNWRRVFRGGPTFATRLESEISAALSERIPDEE